MACPSNSLIDRSPSLITRRAWASISGGGEKVMVLDRLGRLAFNHWPDGKPGNGSIVRRWHRKEMFVQKTP